MEEKWTIRSAARELGIKHCTAKHILYLFRKKGRVVNKKERAFYCDNPEHQNTDAPMVIYVGVPILYFVHADSDSVRPINLEQAESQL